VKEHAIRLAGAFEAPIVIMHSRGHIVPRLNNPHLAMLRAFLTSILNEGCPETYRAKQRQQAAANSLEPLNPPLPMWETEAEQVTKLQQQKVQRIQQQQQQQGTSSAQQQEQQHGQYVQVVKFTGEVGHEPQIASKL
jgi:hypothetical protein